MAGWWRPPPVLRVLLVFLVSRVRRLGQSLDRVEPPIPLGGELSHGPGGLIEAVEDPATRRVGDRREPLGDLIGLGQGAQPATNDCRLAVPGVDQALQPDQAHMPLKAGEVLEVPGDDRADAVHEHRRDQVRVVGLLAPAFDIGQQAEQAVRDLGILGE